jgi:hypothetical protein
MLDLTLTEFKLLASLMRAPKRVFSRAELLTHCLPEGIQERTVDSHISKLRKKLEAQGIQGCPPVSGASAIASGAMREIGTRPAQANHPLPGADGARHHLPPVIGTYVFYAIAVTYVPGSISELDALQGRDDLDWLDHSHCIGDGAVRGGAPLSAS